MFPYQALYGVNPSLIPAYNHGTSTVNSMDELLLKRKEIHQQLKFNLQRAQERMKKNAYFKRK